MLLILWREEIENFFNMEKTDTLKFLKRCEERDGINYEKIAIFLADNGFLRTYKQEFNHLVLDIFQYTINEAKKDPELIDYDRVNGEITLLYYLEMLFNIS